MKKLITVLILAIFLNIVAGYSFSSTPMFEDDFDYFDATKWYNCNGGHFGSVTIRDHLIIDKNCLSFENGTAVINSFKTLEVSPVDVWANAIETIFILFFEL